MEELTTTNRDTIQRWATERGGQPAKVIGTDILRIDFPGDVDENLEPITWDAWFEIFEEKNLALLYQENTADGQASRFNKLIDR